MLITATLSQWILATVLILSSLGVIFIRRPVHASISFLLTLLTLAAMYLQLSAQFIAVMQILVYAGAILVIFMFVIVLFQDAYLQIESRPRKSSPALLIITGAAFVLALIFLGAKFSGFKPAIEPLSDSFGTVESLGRILYVDFFFPFEAIVLLFLVALVGALYIGKKNREQIILSQSKELKNLDKEERI